MVGIPVRYNLEDILSKVSLQELVEGYGVDLEYSNGDFIAFCPFHDDLSTKSFRLYAGESWFCFGCKHGGTIFDFVMMAETVTFAKAVEILAGKTGVGLSDNLPDISIKQTSPLLLFKAAREIVEERILLDMRQQLKEAKNSPIRDVQVNQIQKIIDLWRWVDYSHKFFDGQIVHYKLSMKRHIFIDENEFFSFLTNKLHAFYTKYIEKRNSL